MITPTTQVNTASTVASNFFFTLMFILGVIILLIIMSSILDKIGVKYTNTAGTVILVLTIIVTLSGIGYMYTHCRVYSDVYSIAALEKVNHVNIMDPSIHHDDSASVINDNTGIALPKGDHDYHEYQKVKYVFDDDNEIRNDGVIVFAGGHMSLYRLVGDSMKKMDYQQH